MEDQILQEILGVVKNLQGSFTSVQADIAQLRTDVADLKSDVALLKTDVARIDKRLDMVIEQTAGLLEFRSETLDVLREIREVHVIHSQILGEHEVDIRIIKQKLAS